MYADFVPVLMEVLPDFCELIPGTVETLSSLHEKDILVGGTTGYFEEAMNLCKAKAAAQGYVSDSSIAAIQVQEGRPAP